MWYSIMFFRFIHTETQDGKSALDAHFARSSQFILNWCKEKNNCVTPTQAVIALSSHGGLPNTIVHLVTIDRSHLHRLENLLQIVNDKLKKVVKRCNDVQYIYSESDCFEYNKEITLNELIKIIPQFTVKTYPFSGDKVLQY